MNPRGADRAYLTVVTQHELSASERSKCLQLVSRSARPATHQRNPLCFVVSGFRDIANVKQRPTATTLLDITASTDCAVNPEISSVPAKSRLRHSCTLKLLDHLIEPRRAPHSTRSAAFFWNTSGSTRPSSAPRGIT